MWPDLVCPDDSTKLEAGPDFLRCRFRHRYPLIADIPRLVLGSGTYTDSFGLQWNIFRRTQLDSYTGITISLDRARRCLGEECWSSLAENGGRHVLEVGCGAGRFTEVLLSTGASVTSTDLSAAVEANQENFPQGPRHRVVQADALMLPFAEGQFDVVFCLGVVQHTPLPEATILNLWRQVKPGGWLVFDHYTWTLSQMTKSAPLFRAVLRRMPPDRSMLSTERLVDFFLPWHRAVRGSPALQKIVSRISPLLTYHHVLPLDDAMQRQWALLDTYDSLTDWYKHYRTLGQIRGMLERLGAVDLWCEYGGNGIEARCRRPA